MDDYATLALLASSAFFVALSFGLLYRYRRLSQKVVESSDLGQDLWQALEDRMKKQDERILDVMARFDVVQSRMMAAPLTSASVAVRSPPPSIPQPKPQEDRHGEVMELRRVSQQPESQGPQEESQPRELSEPALKLDDTQKAAIKALSRGELDTIEILKALTKATGVVSREHASRVMKYLFDRGLVVRDDSKKPFVYRLTDEGRRYVL
jgi:hypothetical protein